LILKSITNGRLVIEMIGILLENCHEKTLSYVALEDVTVHDRGSGFVSAISDNFT
jgi:hypothetical protein